MIVAPVALFQFLQLLLSYAKCQSGHLANLSPISNGHFYDSQSDLWARGLESEFNSPDEYRSKESSI